MAEHIYQKSELIEKFDALLGKELECIDNIGFFDKLKKTKLQKGVVGSFIEQCVLGYPPDSKQEADLVVKDARAEVKTELKSTGMIVNKQPQKHFEAKEPMSITGVGVYDIADEVFETSHFWNKLEHMLLVYYLYTAKTPVPPYEYRKFPVKRYEFHEFTEEEKTALKQDWEYVHTLICEIVSKYPGEKTKEWREAVKTDYIDSHGQLRRVLSYIDLAPKFPPRFRLKKPIVSSFISKHFGFALEQLPGKYSVVTDVDAKCRELTATYHGKTIGEIAASLGIDDLAWNKAAAERLIVAMFGGKSIKLNQIEMFQRFGIIAKTITTTATGSYTEDMKLFHIDFQEVTRSEFLGDDGVVRPMQFEDSEFYSYFADHEFLCILFEEPQNDGRAHSLLQNKFIGFKRLVFSDKFIEEKVKRLWVDIRTKISEGSLVDVPQTKKDGTVTLLKNGETSSAPNFMKRRENAVFVRGGATDSSRIHKTEFVNGIRMLPQFVWVKGKAIVEELKHVPQL